MTGLVVLAIWAYLFGILVTLVTVEPETLAGERFAVAMTWPLFAARALWRGFRKAWRA